MAVKNRKRYECKDLILIEKREKSAKRFVKQIFEDYDKVAAEMETDPVILISVENGTYRFMDESTKKKTEVFKASNKYLTKKNMIQVFRGLGFDYEDVVEDTM